MSSKDGEKKGEGGAEPGEEGVIMGSKRPAGDGRTRGTTRERQEDTDS